MKHHIRRNALLASFFLLSLPLFAEFSLTNGRDSIEFSGLLGTMYNYRFYQKTETDYKKNHFVLKNAEFKIKGVVREICEYQLQLDFANLQLDRIAKPDVDSIIVDAFVTLKLPLDISVGYQKIPYSFTSLCTQAASPFMDRAEFVDNAFYRRDLGMLLEYGFWRQRVNLAAGIFNGDGRILKNGDTGGKPEYAVRASFAFPSRYRYAEVDLKETPLPLFALGGNFRYTEKKEDLVNDKDDNYPLKVNGARWLYAADFAAAFMGLSLQVEWHQVKAFPDNKSSVFLPVNTDSFMLGAFLAQLNYYIKPINTVVAIRYDEVDPSSLIAKDTRRTISYGINYLFNGSYDMAVKLNYYQHLPYEGTSLKWKNDDLRVLLQVKF